MPLYVVEQCIHLKKQEIGFCINRPHGTQCFIFLHFINPVEIEFGGQLIHTAPNACFIYPPGVPQHYLARTHPLFHNYIHFSVREEAPFREECPPLNRIFYTDYQDEITELVEEIQVNKAIQSNNFEDRTDDFDLLMSNDMQILFRKLRDEQRHRITSGVYSASATFEQLRNRIYRAPKNWDVSTMAAFVHLSRSRFSVKYHELFGVTPNEDLISASLGLADRLLEGAMSITDIAYECGFSSPEYFIRLYKRRRGRTPGQYRRAIQHRSQEYSSCGGTEKR